MELPPVLPEAEARFRIFRIGAGRGKATHRRAVFRAGFLTMRLRFESYFARRALLGRVPGYCRAAGLIAILAACLPLRGQQDPSSLKGTSPAPPLVRPPNTTPGRAGMFAPVRPAPSSATITAASPADFSSDSMPVDLPMEEPERPRTRLTWEECIRIALAHNPDLEVFRDDVLNSDAVRRGAYSLLYPQISLSAGATRSYTGPGLYAPSFYSNEFSEQASISQTIFNGFLTQGNISQARAQLALAFANMDSQKALSSYDLKTAFAQVVYAQLNVGIARSVIDVRQKNARLVKLLYDSGNEDEGAWLLSKAQLDQAIFSV